MNLKLRSRKLLKLILLLSFGFFLIVLTYWTAVRKDWTTADYQVLDLFYREIIKQGKGPEPSTQVRYITITDRSYDTFGKNFLDRKDVARINNALSELGVEAVAYDVIFARPSNPEADQKLTESLSDLGVVYLPIGFAFSEDPQPFRWEEGTAYERFRADYLRKPVEKGRSRPYFATRALMQYDDFADAAYNSGHISAYEDPDGVYRHMIMLLRVDDQYFPTLSLSMFLDYARVSLEEVVVEWGKQITIPATKDSFLEKDVVIPIDERGRAIVPFARVWDKGYKKMEAHALLEYMEDEDLRGNLTEFFEGNFVFVGDVAIGTADLGYTPLESDVALVILHASMMNGLLTNTFYRKWTYWQVFGLICMIGALLTFSGLFSNSWPLYVSGGGSIIAIIILTWVQYTRFQLIPVTTIGGSTLFFFFGLVIGIKAAITKDRAFIRNTFSRYLSIKVVNEMLENPELLQLGGEERTISVLFSDLANFTSISEKMTPTELVHLLNEYLTEMTDLVLAHGGIIDKYLGDAIMAEYGAPLPMPDHADMAVETGLKMQSRLKELRQIWSEKGLPEMRCRVGINTGQMVVGNMGSNQVFDYTVIGDAVNLASRLEGANKRYNTYLMISEFTYEHLTPDRFNTRVLDVIKVKGKDKAVKVFEVYGQVSDGDVTSNDERYYRTYNEAFNAYLSRRFDSAREKFESALSMRPGDLASEEMIARIDGLDPDALPEDWDGSVKLTTK